MTNRPRGRNNSLPSAPPLPPPSPGDLVWYRDRNQAWRTGIFLKVVERGRKFGLCLVRDAVSKKQIYVKPEEMEAVR